MALTAGRVAVLRLASAAIVRVTLSGVAASGAQFSASVTVLPTRSAGSDDGPPFTTPSTTRVCALDAMFRVTVNAFVPPSTAAALFHS